LVRRSKCGCDLEERLRRTHCHVSLHWTEIQTFAAGRSEPDRDHFAAARDCAQNARRPKRASEYALRLRAKQRLKRQYGMQERDFRRFFEDAQRMRGPSGLNLLQLLERRLDNVVYRLGFA